ncbi:MAG: hypothetical protein QW153_01790 [Candidatus Bilamarchaeaceae archaeon]
MAQVGSGKIKVYSFADYTKYTSGIFSDAVIVPREYYRMEVMAKK